MSPLNPTTPPPPLTGLSSPRVQRPDGALVRWLTADTRLVETRAGELYAEADDLPEPLLLDRAEVVAAAAQVANLIAARLHDARLAARVLDEAIHGDDPDAWTRIADVRPDGRGDQ